MKRAGLLTFVLVSICVMPAGCAEYNQPRQLAGPLETPVEDSESPPYASRPGGLPVLSETSGLPDYLAYAALNNPGLEAAFNRWKAALERVPQEKALPDPRFTYRYFIEEIETRVGAQRQSFGISQTFPWFGKLKLRGDAAAEAANAEYQRYQAVKLELFYRVKSAYYEYYYLGRAIAITAENVELLKHIEAVARTRYKVAAAEHSDVIRAQVELGKLDDRLRSLQELRRPIVSRLNAALNRPPDAPVPLPAAIEKDEVSFTDQQMLGWLAQANPQLKAMDAEIAALKHKIELAKKDYFPDVTLGADFVDVSDSTGGRRPSDDGKDAVSVMASINLPIWWEKLSAGVREARRRYWAMVHDKTEKTNSLSADLKMALYQFRDAERKISLYGQTLLPKARESLKVTEATFRAGKGSFIDLVDSQRVLLEFELAYERALVDRAGRLAGLEMLIGRELPRSAGEADDSPGRDADRAPQEQEQ